MSVGLPATKPDIDVQAGSIALRLRDVMRDIASLQTYFAATPDADLIALGYTSGEVAIVKSASSDMNQLRTIYEGAATLGSAKDFRTFAKLLIGPR